MDKRAATAAFECLSSGIRLDAYRLLVEQEPMGLVAGDLAQALDLSPANMSFHLKALAQAGLVSVEQEGRFQRYRARLAVMRELIEYMTEHCCAAHPQCCDDAPVRPKRAVAEGRRRASR